MDYHEKSGRSRAGRREQGSGYWLGAVLSLPVDDGVWFLIIFVVTSVIALAERAAGNMSEHRESISAFLRFVLPVIFCLLIGLHGLLKKTAQPLYTLCIGMMAGAMIALFFTMGLILMNKLGDSLMAAIQHGTSGLILGLLIVAMPFFLFFLVYLPLLLLAYTVAKLLSWLAETEDMSAVLRITVFWLPIIFWVCAFFFTLFFIGVFVIADAASVVFGILSALLYSFCLHKVNGFAWKRYCSIFVNSLA